MLERRFYEEKLRMIALSICALTLFTATPAMAEKKYFDFTVTTAPADRVGRTAQASKADGEQNSYITVTNFTKNSSIILHVDQGSEYGIRSESIFYHEPTRTAYVNKPQARAYMNGYASTSAKYWLHYDNYGSITCWVAGRYNP